MSRRTPEPTTRLVAAASGEFLAEVSTLSSPAAAVNPLGEVVRAQYRANGVSIASGYIQEAVTGLYMGQGEAFDLLTTLYEESCSEEIRQRAHNAAGFRVNSQNSHFVTCQQSTVGGILLAERMIRLVEAGDTGLLPIARVVVEETELGLAEPRLLSSLYCAGDTGVRDQALTSIQVSRARTKEPSPAVESYLFAMAERAITTDRANDALLFLDEVNNSVDCVLLEVAMVEAGYKHFIDSVEAFVAQRHTDYLNMSLERSLAGQGLMSYVQKIRARALLDAAKPLKYDAYNRGEDLRLLHELGDPDASKRLRILAQHSSNPELVSVLCAAGMHEEAAKLARRYSRGNEDIEGLQYQLMAGPFKANLWRQLFDYYLYEARDIVTAGQLIRNLADESMTPH